MKLIRYNTHPYFDPERAAADGEYAQAFARNERAILVEAIAAVGLYDTGSAHEVLATMLLGQAVILVTFSYGHGWSDSARENPQKFAAHREEQQDLAVAWMRRFVERWEAVQ